VRVLISGGGTGGHIYPGVAIAKKILQKYPDAKILFVGTENGLEKKLIPHEGFEIQFITVEGLNKRLSKKTLSSIKKVFKGFFDANKIINTFRPDIVIGTGGYVCGPVVLAASLKGIPTIIHEQNAIPGLTNKILSYFVSKIAITFSESEKFFPKSKVVLTGNPIRENILRKIGESNKEKWGINKDRPTVLAVGGSRGATRLNDFVINLIPKLIEEKIQLIFITGEREYERVIRTLKENGINNLEGIIIIPYAYNMDDALTACDLIISRAGATIISEITALGIPSILIPSPNVANNHQEYNALSLEQNGAAIVIKESQISDDVFSQQVINLAKNKDLLTKMSSNAKKIAKIDAADKICEIILELVKKDD